MPRSAPLAPQPPAPPAPADSQPAAQLQPQPAPASQDADASASNNEPWQTQGRRSRSKDLSSSQARPTASNIQPVTASAKRNNVSHLPSSSVIPPVRKSARIAAQLPSMGSHAVPIIAQSQAHSIVPQEPQIPLRSADSPLLQSQVSSLSPLTSSPSQALGSSNAHSAFVPLSRVADSLQFVANPNQSPTRHAGSLASLAPSTFNPPVLAVSGNPSALISLLPVSYAAAVRSSRSDQPSSSALSTNATPSPTEYVTGNEPPLSGSRRSISVSRVSRLISSQSSLENCTPLSQDEVVLPNFESSQSGILFPSFTNDQPQVDIDYTIGSGRSVSFPGRTLINMPVFHHNINRFSRSNSREVIFTQDNRSQDRSVYRNVNNNVRGLLTPERQHIFDRRSATSSRSTAIPDINSRGVSSTQRAPISGVNIRVIDADMPSKHVSGIDGNTRLLDIPCAKYGTMLGWTPSVNFIPEKHVKRIRRVFSDAMNNIILHPDDSSNWKKLFLLPSLTLVRCSKTVLNDRLQAIRDDNWHFLVDDVVSKQGISSKPLNSSKRVSKYLCAGRISKAMEAVTNDNGMAPCSDEVFKKLESKHPQNQVEVSEAILQEMHNFVVSPEDKISVNKHLIRAIIGKWKTMVRCGPDKLRNEHLKLLIGHHLKDQDEDEIIFTDQLVEIVQLIVNCEYPAEIAPLLRDNETVAIPKGQIIDSVTPDVRPIGIGVTMRKLCSACLAQKLKQFNLERFKEDQQMGLKPNGVEAIVHFLNLSFEAHPEFDLYTIDADNAFNRSNRILGLQEVMKHCPSVFPFVRSMYLCCSNGWYQGLPAGIKNIGSLHGYHQGDVLASWLYVLTNQPLLESIDKAVCSAFPLVTSSHRQLWYIDDGSIHASHEVMEVIIHCLKTEGPKYGYHINPSKGKYLIGRCDSVEQSEQIRARLVNEFGLADNIIINHPDNNPSVTSLEENKKIYGVKVVGSFIGTPEFIRNNLDLYFQDLEICANKLMNHKDLQERMILFRDSFIKKPLHIFRTINPIFTQEFASKFECLKIKILCSILGFESSDLSDLH